jgi:glycosyltransferase involved in cell wall biosynthesis
VTAHTEIIVFVGQFPPPLNGLTFITEQLAQALKCAGHNIITKDMTGRYDRRHIAFHVSRVAKTLFALFSLIRFSSVTQRSCYLTADGGLGLIYTVLVAAIARFLGYRLFIHHHSFSYIDRWRPLMSMVLACSGTSAVHVCLCYRMAQDLSRTYGMILRSIVLSNAAFVDRVHFNKPAVLREKIVIGLLSNLTAEKGLYAFLEVLRMAKSRGLPVHGILAGPIQHEFDAKLIASLKSELGESLEHRGPVYGQVKAQFFEDIDVFVFPTTYPNEAQPIVVFESLAHGVPVISCNRGCIHSQVAGAGYVIAQDAEPVENIIAILERYTKVPNHLVSHKELARAAYEREWNLAKIQLATLLSSDPIRVAPAH